MTFPYTLHWLDRLTAGNTPMGDVTELLIPTWRRTIRRVGGCWLGTAEVRASRSDLDDLFQDGLLREIRESCYGEQTWSGLAVMLEYKRGNDVFVRDASRMINATRARYTRLYDNLLTNGSAESGAWTAYNGATVTQSTVWVTDGTYSCKVEVADAVVRGAFIQSAVAIVAEISYSFAVKLHIVSGGWRVDARRADNNQSIGNFTTSGETGDVVATFTIPANNTYAGDVYLLLANVHTLGAGTCYADGATFQQAAAPAETGWITDDESIEEYGRYEYITNLDERSTADANAHCAGLLSDSAWPTTIPPRSGSTAASDDPGEDVLTLTYAGYWAMLNRRYSTLAGTKTKSEWVTALAALQPEFIATGIIDTNAESFTLGEQAQPLGDVLKSISEARGSNGDLYALGVDAARRLNYEHIETELDYVLRDTRLRSVTQEVIEPAIVKPGWMLWGNMPIALPRLSSARANPNWVYLDEVELQPPTSECPDGVVTFNLDSV